MYRNVFFLLVIILIFVLFYLFKNPQTYTLYTTKESKTDKTSLKILNTKVYTYFKPQRENVNFDSNSNNNTKKKIAIRISFSYSRELHEAIESAGGMFFLYDIKQKNIVGKITSDMNIIEIDAPNSSINAFRIRGNTEKFILNRIRKLRGLRRYRIYLYLPSSLLLLLRNKVKNYMHSSGYAVANLVLIPVERKLAIKLAALRINNKVIHVNKYVWAK